MFKVRFAVLGALLTICSSVFAVSQLNDSNFRQGISKGIVVVDFYADWCPACKHLEPTLEKLEKEMQGIAFARVNVDNAPNTKKEQGIRPLPTVVIFKDGREVTRRSGSADEKTMKAFIRSAQ